MRSFRAVLILVLAAGVALPLDSAWAQKRGRGRGRPQLPGALGRLQSGQYAMLDQLLDRAISWIGGAEPKPSADEAGNFFGHVVLPTPNDNPDPDDPPPEPVAFGLIVLGSLDNQQIRLLSDLARSQLTTVRRYREKHRELLIKAAELREQERPPRNFEREVAAIGKELGEIEIQMGLAQATAFIQLAQLLADDQVEYFQLLRRNPGVASADHPSVVKIRELAEKLAPEHRKQVLAVAERAFLFLTGTAAQNLPSLRKGAPTDPESDEAERKMGFINALNPAQLGQLAALVSSESRAMAEADAKRLQVAAMLDTLKANKKVEERRLAIPGAQMGELQAKLEIIDAQALERLRSSMSGAQRAFISRNILVKEP